jgi:hypothetical protein
MQATEEGVGGGVCDAEGCAAEMWWSEGGVCCRLERRGERVQLSCSRPRRYSRLGAWAARAPLPLSSVFSLSRLDSSPLSSRQNVRLESHSAPHYSSDPSEAGAAQARPRAQGVTRAAGRPARPSCRRAARQKRFPRLCSVARKKRRGAERHPAARIAASSCPPLHHPLRRLQHAQALGGRQLLRRHGHVGIGVGRRLVAARRPHRRVALLPRLPLRQRRLGAQARRSARRRRPVARRARAARAPQARAPRAHRARRGTRQEARPQQRCRLGRRQPGAGGEWAAQDGRLAQGAHS